MSSPKVLLSSALVALLAASSLVQAHIQLATPYPINSALNPSTPESEKDYSMTSPLVTDGTYPCKGFIGQGYDQGTIPTYTAGESMAIKLAGTAVHGGGSCQLSLSYDNGTNFRVIESRIGGCPSDSLTFDVNLPSTAPAGTNVLFSWSWSNRLGNREFYQNCAIINIDSDATEPLTGPTIFVSNVDVNSCTTVEGTAVVYPYPGDVVTYGGDYAGLTIGNGLTSGAGISGTDCFAPDSDGAGTTSSTTSTTTAASSTVSATTSTSAASSSAVVQTSSTTDSAAITTSTAYSSVQSTASSTVSPASETSAIASTDHSSVQSAASSTVSPASSETPATTSSFDGDRIGSSSAVPSTSAEASSTNGAESIIPSASVASAYVDSSSVVSSPTSTVVPSTSSSAAPTSTSARSVAASTSTSASAANAAASADTACTSGEWRCQSSVLQTCSWGKFVTMKDCSTKAGTVCNAVDPIGCVWPDQVSTTTAATSATATTATAAAASFATSVTPVTSATTATSDVSTVTPVSSSSATSAVTVNNAVVTSTGDARSTTTSASPVVSTSVSSSTTTSTPISAKTSVTSTSTTAATATAASTTCSTGSWACSGSVLQQCVNGKLVDLADCSSQTGTVCNAATPVGCVWPWQVAGVAKRDSVGHAPPTGHEGHRRAGHGKRRASTH